MHLQKVMKGSEFQLKKSKLSEHKFKKGEFITPFKSAFQDIGLHEVSWFRDRAPQYVWIGLILDYYGRNEGMQRCGIIIKNLLKSEVKLNSLKISEIISMKDNEQQTIYKIIKQEISVDVLNPLTVIFPYSINKLFANEFSVLGNSVKMRIEQLNRVVNDLSDQQSHNSTDIRFIVTYYILALGKIVTTKNQSELILKYPRLSHDKEEMKLIRPLIRNLEALSLSDDEQRDKKFISFFWKEYSEMVDCDLFVLDFDDDFNPEGKMLEYLNMMEYLKDLFVVMNPLDNKMLVLIGITTYSYKRLKELVDHSLFNTIAGRSIIRVLIENHIMMKYLLKKEKDIPNIWEEYQLYGIGQYKLIAKRWLDSTEDLSDSHVMFEYLEILSNEYKDEMFINMDTRYFDKTNIRIKAEEVNEKELYGLFYDYDSAYEHGMWGAIRESSLIKCTQPAHQFHCVPDIYNQQKLKSVWYDCEKVMDKTFDIMKSLYGKSTSISEGVK